MALSLFQPSVGRDLLSLPDELFGGASSLMRPFGLETLPRAMPIDVVERENSYEVKADIPSVKKEDISVSVQDNNVLTIKVDSKGEKQEEKEEAGYKIHRQERHNMFVQRSMRMPSNANLEDVKAKYENGVLSLTLAKKEAEEVKRITVE